MKARILAHAAIAGVLLATAAAAARGADDGCYPTPTGPDTPTGIAGCVRYGSGTASWYHGAGVARNDCTWTVRHSVGCQPIAIRSLRTGVVVRVTPTDFCDCYTGTAAERIVDLDPATLAALGLDPQDGLYPVEVWPIDADGAPFDPSVRALGGSPSLAGAPRGATPAAPSAVDGSAGASVPAPLLPDTSVGDAS